MHVSVSVSFHPILEATLNYDEDRFGQFVSSEVTRDMLLTGGDPAALNVVAMWMIAVCLYIHSFFDPGLVTHSILF